MHRIDGLYTYDTMPESRESSGNPGYFGPGNPASGRMSTRVTYEWANAVQEEIANAVTGAGLSLDKTSNAQLLAAIKGLLNDSAGNQYRLSMIGAPHFVAGTVLDTGWIWPDGSLITLADYPEFAARYTAGKLGNMVMAYTTDTATLAANLGKYMVSANGLGLYAPRAGDQFFRNWVSGLTRAAGSAQGDAIRNIAGSTSYSYARANSAATGVFFYNSLAEPTQMQVVSASGGRSDLCIDASRLVPTAAENRPVNIAQPVAIYLGIPA